MFGLSERTQKGEALWSAIGKNRISWKLREDCQRLVTLEVLGGICEAIARGTVRTEENVCADDLPDETDFADLVDLLPTFTTDEERQGLKECDMVDILHQDCTKWFPVFEQGLRSMKFKLVNRQPLGKGLSRIITAARKDKKPSLSNKTITCPGPGKLPHISTTGTSVPFTRTVSVEFVSGIQPIDVWPVYP